jgi:hypothetical protein
MQYLEESDKFLLLSASVPVFVVPGRAHSLESAFVEPARQINFLIQRNSSHLPKAQVFIAFQSRGSLTSDEVSLFGRKLCFSIYELFLHSQFQAR